MSLNYLAIVAAAVAAFIISMVWYIGFGKQTAELRPANAAAADEMASPEAWKLLIELARSLIVAAVLAGIAARIGPMTGTEAALLGLAVWVGFPVTLLTGSVIWESVPWKLAAIHAGDWLVKLVIIAVIVGVWR